MKTEPRPMFLEKQTYRRRRMADAARLLPVLGAILVCLPLLWSRGEGAMATTHAMVYLFGVWLFLAIISAVISRKLRSDGDRNSASGGR